MKLTTPEIVWHSKEPVYSADFHRCGELWRLVTGGADKDVKIWKVVMKEGKVKVVFMSSLSRHSGAINVVRFSPNGDLLASAGDDHVVCLWKLGEGGGAGNLVAVDKPTPNEENWTVTKTLRGHLEDIYDACWSADSGHLVTGSVDNTAIIWDVNKGQQVCVLGESKQYVQGVSWDPIGQYIATLSNDRYLRVYSAEQKYKCVHTVGKLTVPEQEGGAGSKQFRMWIDESLSFFFRRLSFSPDGSLLVVPAGRFENGDKVTNMTYIFTKRNLSKPAVCLPGPEKATVVVKFCPVLFELHDSTDKAKDLFSLPYRMVYAVASLDAVLLYDTQQATPFAYLSNMHYSGITDLAWSDDGLVLVLTSSDAYCSIVTFEPGELGVAVATEKLPASMKREDTAKVNGTGNGTTRRVVGDKKIEEGMSTARESPDERSGSAGDREEKSNERGIVEREEVNRVADGGGAGAGPRESAAARVKKGKRRIRTTLVESFTSPEKTPPHSPSLTPFRKTASTTLTETETRTVCSPRDSADLSEDGSSSFSTLASDGTPSSTLTAKTPNSTGEKKARRVQLVTLSTTPPQSHDSGSTHSLSPTQAAVISCDTGDVDCNSDIIEPMEIQVIE